MKHIYSSVTLDRRSNVDFETQIANELRNKIMLNKLDPKLLDASYLASILNIDEKTVINGFNKLVSGEVLSFDRKTKSYYVNYKEFTIIDNNQAITYHDLMKKLNQKPSVKTIFTKEVVCDEFISHKTGFNMGEKLIHQVRLYYGDHYPKYYTKTYFSKKFMEKYQFKIQNIEKTSYIKVLKEHNITFKSKRILKGVKLPDEVNDYLNQPHGTAGLSSFETHVDQNGEIIIFSFVYMNMNYALKVI